MLLPAWAFRLPRQLSSHTYPWHSCTQGMVLAKVARLKREVSWGGHGGSCDGWFVWCHVPPVESCSAKPESCWMPGVAAMVLCDLREAVPTAYRHPVEMRSVGPLSSESSSDVLPLNTSAQAGRQRSPPDEPVTGAVITLTLLLTAHLHIHKQYCTLVSPLGSF